MRKIFSLFLNEMLKIRKKVAVFVLVIVMTVGMIGCSVIFKTDESIEYNSFDEEYIEYNIEAEKEYKETLENILADELYQDKYSSQIICQLKNDIHSCYIYGTYTKENNIKVTSFKYDLSSVLVKNYTTMIEEEYYSEEGTESDLYKIAKEEYDYIDNIIKTSNYKQYIEDENKRIEAISDLSEAEKKSIIEYNNALYKMCPTGEYNSYEEKNNAESLLQQKTNIESSLEFGYDTETGGNLTDEKREELELSLAVVNKKIDESLLLGSTSDRAVGWSFSMSLSVGQLFTTIILIIIAGAMMSGETSTGTIKSLIIAPVKRWKIYVSKYLALIFVSFALTLYVYIIAVLTNGLLFGFSSFGTEVYVVFGKVVSMNFLLVQLISNACFLVPLIVVVTLAYMMSIVTKNTAAAVSVTTGAYLGGSTVSTILMAYLSGKPYITKFNPFSNIGWFNMIFKSMSDSEMGMNDIMGGTIIESPSSFAFAVIYVVVMLALMIWIGIESFCKKDIK